MTADEATLALWEAVQVASPVARGAVIAAWSGLATDVEEALDLPVGDCAAGAARAYVQWFGPSVEAVAGCGSCGATADLVLDLEELTGPVLQDGVDATSREQDGFALRAPTTRDLLAVRGVDDPASALLDRCVRPLERAAVSDPAVRERLEATCEELAGAAALVLALDCPTCGNRMQPDVDLVTVVCDRLDIEAHRLVREVAELARGYGWAESEILRMPASRRTAYLRLLPT